MNFSVDLNGKVALVTGAGEGVGRAIALALGRSGASVFVNDLNPDRADSVAEAINGTGGVAAAWGADVTNKFQVGSMIENLRDRFGAIHILINAAGVDRPSSVIKLDEYDWRRIIEVNLTGAFFCCQMAGRVMVDEGGGVIVNVASIYGAALARADSAAYAASKAGLIGLTRALAVEWGASGVRVNAVCPGDVQESATSITPTNPLGRAGTPDEVANAVLFLCSEAASFIHGGAIAIDGGLSLL